jgi:hypothetical protein
MLISVATEEQIIASLYLAGLLYQHNRIDLDAETEFDCEGLSDVPINAHFYALDDSIFLNFGEQNEDHDLPEDIFKVSLHGIDVKTIHIEESNIKSPAFFAIANAILEQFICSDKSKILTQSAMIHARRDTYLNEVKEWFISNQLKQTYLH